MRIRYVLSIVPLLIAGCVSVPPATQMGGGSSSAWQGKTLALTSRSRESLLAVTAGKAAFALVGVAAMVEAGNKIVKDNEIEDPVPHLAADLADAAVSKYSVVRSDGPAMQECAQREP